MYCSFSLCSSVAFFAEGKYIEFNWCISHVIEKLCHANLGLGLGLWHVPFLVPSISYFANVNVNEKLGLGLELGLV